jgi:hypothetical protein
MCESLGYLFNDFIPSMCDEPVSIMYKTLWECKDEKEAFVQTNF